MQQTTHILRVHFDKFGLIYTPVIHQESEHTQHPQDSSAVHLLHQSHANPPHIPAKATADLLSVIMVSISFV